MRTDLLGTIESNVKTIRSKFLNKWKHDKYVIDKSGCKMLEIINASFVADEDTIFGKVNYDYIQKELDWYLSKSLYVEDIPGKTPKIWEQVADKNGKINSNYGYLVYSEENYQQFNYVIDELIQNPDSRRATMIYTRPSIWEEYNKNGMSDFICTTNSQYFIRDNKLVTCVNMRSNDAWAGYRNDLAWQIHVRKHLFVLLKNVYPDLEIGKIYWNVGSLHIYERQFYLLEYYAMTGKVLIDKSEYIDWKENQ